MLITKIAAHSSFNKLEKALFEFNAVFRNHPIVTKKCQQTAVDFHNSLLFPTIVTKLTDHEK